jgi:hypothetical protein
MDSSKAEQQKLLVPGGKACNAYLLSYGVVQNLLTNQVALISKHRGLP